MLVLARSGFFTAKALAPAAVAPLALGYVGYIILNNLSLQVGAGAGVIVIVIVIVCVRVCVCVCVFACVCAGHHQNVGLCCCCRCVGPPTRTEHDADATLISPDVAQLNTVGFYQILKVCRSGGRLPLAVGMLR